MLQQLILQIFTAQAQIVQIFAIFAIKMRLVWYLLRLMGREFLQIVEVLKHFILLKAAKSRAICAHFIQMFVKFQSIFGISTTDKLEITRNIIES